MERGGVEPAWVEVGDADATIFGNVVFVIKYERSGESPHVYEDHQHRRDGDDQEFTGGRGF